MDPLIATALVSGGIFLVAYLLGRVSVDADIDAEIEDAVSRAIDHLKDNGYLNFHYDENGELHIDKIDEGDLQEPEDTV